MGGRCIDCARLFCYDLSVIYRILTIQLSEVILLGRLGFFFVSLVVFVSCVAPAPVKGRGGIRFAVAWPRAIEPAGFGVRVIPPEVDVIVVSIDGKDEQRQRTFSRGSQDVVRHQETLNTGEYRVNVDARFGEVSCAQDTQTVFIEDGKTTTAVFDLRVSGVCGAVASPTPSASVFEAVPLSTPAPIIPSFIPSPTPAPSVEPVVFVPSPTPIPTLLPSPIATPSVVIEQAPLVFTLVATAPSLYEGKASVSKGSVVSFETRVSSGDSARAVRVEYTVGSVIEKRSAAPFVFLFDTTTMGAGDYHVEARVYDAQDSILGVSGFDLNVYTPSPTQIAFVPIATPVPSSTPVPPAISGISPSGTVIGKTVTLTGSGFTVPGFLMRVGGMSIPAAVYTIASDTQIVLNVAPSIDTGPVKITTDNGASNEPLLGVGKLFFTSPKGGNEDIYTRKSNGTNEAQRTTNATADSRGEPCLQGTTYAWARQMGANGFDIFAYSFGSNVETNLTPNPGDQDQPSWSVDCSKITFTQGGDIYTMNADGSSVFQVTTGGLGHENPTFDSSGGKILYQCKTGGTFDLCIVQANGAGNTNITNTPAFSERFPRFNPLGTKIVYDDDFGVPSRLRVCNADGTSPVTLTTPAGNSIQPDWFPAGDGIVFINDSTSAMQMYRMNLDGTDLQNLSANDGNGYFYPHFSRK